MATFSWSSSNSTFATVSDGIVTGGAIGNATITATSDNGIERTCVVHVCYPVTAVSFAEPSVSVMETRQTQLTANVTARTQSLVNEMVTFASSDESVAVVDQNGIVTAVGAGTAQITASAGKISASCTVTVNPLDHAHEPVTDEAVPATCTTDGLTEGSHCETCGGILSGHEIIPALGHDIVSHEAQEASCTGVGWDAYEACTSCDYSTYEEIPELPHALNFCEGQPATCTESGWEDYDYCAYCDFTTYAEIPALGHAEVTDPYIAPTRMTYGKTEGSHCDRCGEILVKQELIVPLADAPLVALPGAVKEIAEEAYFGSGSIQCVILPNGCTTVGSRAFADCASLRIIEIPASVTEIAADAFEGSPNVVIVATEGCYALTFAKEQHITYLSQPN